MKKIIKDLIDYIFIATIIVVLPTILSYILLAFLFLELNWMTENPILGLIYRSIVVAWTIIVFVAGIQAYNESH